MSKKKSSKIDLGGGEPLHHNPFAALRGSLGPGPVDKAPVTGDRGAPAPETPSPEGLGEVVVRLERKGRGGKAVCVVSWTAGSMPPIEARRGAASGLARALGTGARLEGEDLVVQGASVERVALWCEAHGARRVTRGT